MDIIYKSKSKHSVHSNETATMDEKSREFKLNLKVPSRETVETLIFNVFTKIAYWLALTFPS